VSTAFGCPYEGDVPVERVLSVAERALATAPTGCPTATPPGWPRPAG
jgi:hypothetical protein